MIQKTITGISLAILFFNFYSALGFSPLFQDPASNTYLKKETRGSFSLMKYYLATNLEKNPRYFWNLINKYRDTDSRARYFDSLIVLDAIYKFQRESKLKFLQPVYYNRKSRHVYNLDYASKAYSRIKFQYVKDLLGGQKTLQNGNIIVLDRETQPFAADKTSSLHGMTLIPIKLPNKTVYSVYFLREALPVELGISEFYKQGNESIFLRGWVLSDSNINTIQVHYAGKKLGEAKMGMPRPDIFYKFPKYLEKNSGFLFKGALEYRPGNDHIDLVFMSDEETVAKKKLLLKNLTTKVES